MFIKIDGIYVNTTLIQSLKCYEEEDKFILEFQIKNGQAYKERYDTEEERETRYEEVKEKGIGGRVRTEEIEVEPSEEEQTILPSEEKVYISKVNVKSVLDVEPNLVPENICIGTTIFGVEGNVERDKPDQTKEQMPSDHDIEVRADTGYELAMCKVLGDENLASENIKEGTSIFGVEGSCVELNGYTANVLPQIYEQEIEPDNVLGNCFEKVVVGKVESYIDSNITPSNIKQGVSILGVDGEVIPVNNTTKTVSPSTSNQTYSVDSNHTGFSSFTVNKVTKSIDSNIQKENIRKGITILGEEGMLDVMAPQSKEVVPTKSTQTILPDEADEYNCLSEVIVKPIPSNYIDPSGNLNITEGGDYNVRNYNSVNVDTSSGGGSGTLDITANGEYDVFSKQYVDVDIQPSLTTRTVTPTEESQTIGTPTGYDGLSSVTVEAIPSEYIIPSGVLTISEDGDANCSQYETVRVMTNRTDFTMQQVYNGLDTRNYYTSNNFRPVSSSHISRSINTELEVPEFTVSDQPIGLRWYRTLIGNATELSTKCVYNNIVAKSSTTGATLNYVYIQYDDYSVYKIENGGSIQLPNKTGNVYLLLSIYEKNGWSGVTYSTTYTGSLIIYGGRINLEPNKTATPTEEQQVITPSEGYVGMKQVVVEPIPSEYIIPTGSETITENGTYDISDKEEVVVDIEIPTPTYQTKTVTPSESAQTITPDTGYDGLSSVEVSAIMIDGLTVAQIREKLQAIVEGDM